MADETILIPPFLSADVSYTTLSSSCTFVCETSCEEDYEGCDDCERCENACQVTCQDCQDDECDSCESVQTSYIAASFSITGVSSSGVTIYVTLGSGYTQFRIFVRLASDSSSSVYDQTVTKSSSFSYTISGLDASNNYAINVCSISSAQSEWADAQTFTTSASISQWSWTSSNGSASSAQTQKAYTAVSSRGLLSDFSYLVWNDLCDLVSDAAVASGDAWITTWGTLSFTKMSSGNKTITAQRFNALKNNIDSRISTGIQDMEPGDIIYGKYFTTLTASLNSWISSI
jgi:hypothetical protein